MSKSYRYLTMAETLRENGLRHTQRGFAHRAAGREDWAQGSFAKAHRNFESAKMFDGIGAADEVMREQIKSLADKFSDAILYGK